MCLQYKPTVVASFCIHLACKWTQWEIPLSNEKKEWFSYVDPTVTAELLQQLTEEFLVVFDQCQSRLKTHAFKSQSQSNSPLVSNRFDRWSFQIVEMIVYRSTTRRRESLLIFICTGRHIMVKESQVGVVLFDIWLSISIFALAWSDYKFSRILNDLQQHSFVCIMDVLRNIAKPL